MSLYDDWGFNRLQDSINAMMGDFSRGIGRRRGGRGGLGGDFGWNDPFFSFGYDPMLMDTPMTPPLLTSGGMGMGMGQDMMERGRGVGKGGEENKMDDSGTLTTQQSQQLTRPTGQLPVLRCRVNVEDLADKYIVTAEVPAFDKSNLKVHINDNNVLTISGEQKREHMEESRDKRYLRMERSFGTVQRSLQLPRNVDKDHVGANYENGILHIHIPKTEKKLEGSQIHIA